MKAHTFHDEDTPADEKLEVDCKRALTDDELIAGVTIANNPPT